VKPSSVVPSRAVTPVVLAALVVACGGGAPSAASADAATCSGETRPPLDCSSEVAYQGTDVKGGMSVLGVGKASGDVEQKALRQIDDQTALYITEARRLCDEYNKCVLDRDTYATRSENLRRRLAKVPELVEELRAAPNEDARRNVLAKAYRALVPDAARTELALDFSVLAQRPAEADPRVVGPGAPLPTGTRVAFMLSVSHPAYVYVFQKSPAGRVSVLFPEPRIALENPVPAGANLRIPPAGATYRLDEHDVGSEAVYLVASLKPLAELGNAAERLAADRPTAGDPTLGRVTALDAGCQARGFTLEQDAAPSGCVRTRGLVLDGTAPSAGAPNAPKPSLSTATEAADDTIATVFRFEHTL
jgi:uncharacterized protein DUF4384